MHMWYIMNTNGPTSILATQHGVFLEQDHLLSIRGSTWNIKGIKMVHHVPRWSMMAQHILHGIISLLDGATCNTCELELHV